MTPYPQMDRCGGIHWTRIGEQLILRHRTISVRPLEFLMVSISRRFANCLTLRKCVTVPLLMSVAGNVRVKCALLVALLMTSLQLGWPLSVFGQQTAEATVAGRTLTGWVHDLEDSNGVVRRRAVLSLGAFGKSAIPALTKSLSHDDIAVRYWAASELGDIGEQAASAEASLKVLLTDQSIGVRMAAGYALCRIGKVADGLPSLLDALKHNERGVWNSAGDFLARVGPPAKPAIPAIEQAALRNDTHIADICNEALRRIRGDEHKPLPTSTSVSVKDENAGDASSKDNTLNTTPVPAKSVFSKPFFEATTKSNQSRQLSSTAKSNRTNSTPPNVLWISAEDISPNLGCYGDQYAVTPRLDRLASEGVRFTNCFTHAGVCAISRSGLITGMYPMAIGSQHMRSNVVPPSHVKCFPEYLRAAGYWCTNRSKTDYNFNAPPSAWDENSPQSRDWRGRSTGQPFFSVINLTTTHESQIRAKFSDTQHDPEQAKLPPYIPDTPTTRRDWARYADLLTTLDRQVAAILDQLEGDGLTENTIVFFWGDHGQGLPRGKRWLYDSGTRVPLIIRWPDKLEAGAVCDDLVCFLDFAPTMLQLAGVEVPKHFHGRTLPPVRELLRGKEVPREFVFGHRDRMDETYDLIRSVRDVRFKYIRNFAPRRTYAQNIAYMNEMPTMRELRRLNASGQLTETAALFFRESKPIEELYDTQADPHEVVNLADQSQHADTLRRLRTALEQWQEEINDTGLTPEPLLAEQMRPDFKIATTALPEINFIRAETTDRVAVTMACSTDGASIVYTTEVREQPHWQLYAQPIQAEPGTTIRAKACRLGFHDSREIRVEAK